MNIDYSYTDLPHSIEFDCILYDETSYYTVLYILYTLVFHDYLPNEEYFKECDTNCIDHLGTYNDFLLTLHNVDEKIEINIGKKSPEDLKNKVKKFINKVVELSFQDL